jgi:glycosyltransferase involved in cell wall biosynthesis
MSRSSGQDGLPRVLHIVPALYGRTGRIAGGAERYAMGLATSMAEQVPTRLVSFGDEDRHERHGALSVRLIGGARAIGGQPSNPFARQILREILRADVVHCHQQHIFVTKVASAVRRLARRPVFVTDHGGGAWDFTGRLPLEARFDGYLHVSAFSRRVAGQQDDPRAQVIYGGVDLETFSPPEQPGERQRALFVGRLLPHKGVDDLIDALPDGVGLDIAGPALDPRYLGDLRRLAIGRDVKFHHDWDDTRVREAYRHALCVVLPSVYRDRYGGETPVPELLGQTLLEGMACAAAVVCTDVGGMPELVEDGRTGFVVAPGDVHALRERIALLADGTGRAAAMGEAGHRRIRERFDWSDVVDRCLSAYTGRRTDD